MEKFYRGIWKWCLQVWRESLSGKTPVHSSPGELMPMPPPLYLPPEILEAAQRSGIKKILVILDPPPQDKALRVEFLENGYATWKPYGEFPLEGIEALCQDWVKALRKHQFSRKNWHVEILYQINLQTATVLQWPAFQQKRKTPARSKTLAGEPHNAI